MSRMVPCLIVVVALSPLADLRAQEASDLQAIVEKSVAAAGGLENLEKAQTHRGREEGTYYGTGDGMPFTATFASDPPDRFRLEIQGAFTIVINGDEGWVSAGGAVQEMNEEQLAEQKEEQYIGWVAALVPLVKQKDQFKLSAVEGEQVNGRETLGVQVRSEGHRDVKLYFDKETYDLLQAKYQVKSAEQGNVEVEQELTVKKYMDVAGAKLPSEMVILRDGDKYVEAKITEIEPVEKFEDDVFAKP